MKVIIKFFNITKKKTEYQMFDKCVHFSRRNNKCRLVPLYPFSQRKKLRHRNEVT